MSQFGVARQVSLDGRMQQAGGLGDFGEGISKTGAKAGGHGARQGGFKGRERPSDTSQVRRKTRLPTEPTALAERRLLAPLPGRGLNSRVVTPHRSGGFRSPGLASRTGYLLTSLRLALERRMQPVRSGSFPGGCQDDITRVQPGCVGKVVGNFQKPTLKTLKVNTGGGEGS